MLRAWQRAAASLDTAAAVSFVRSFAAPVASGGKAVVGGKDFDPSGPLSQIDTLAEGLDKSDPFVKSILRLKEIKVATDKLQSEETLVRPGAVPAASPTSKKTAPAQPQIASGAFSMHMAQAFFVSDGWPVHGGNYSAGCTCCRGACVCCRKGMTSPRAW